MAKKEEVLIRKMVVKTDGEEFLYSFLLFNSYKLKASIDGMGDTQYCSDNKCQGNINTYNDIIRRMIVTFFYISPLRLE